MFSPKFSTLNCWPTTELDVSNADKVDYAISYTVDGQTYWDNNGGINYTVTFERQ